MVLYFHSDYIIIYRSYYDIRHLVRNEASRDTLISHDSHLAFHRMSI